ncbi:hypothetical protein Tco_1035506 [Tanacetum coccineum]
MNELNELWDEAYENSLIYKEKTKKIHDSKIKNRVFNVGIPSSESKVHIEVLSVLWGNRLPIPDGSLLLPSPVYYESWAQQALYDPIIASYTVIGAISWAMPWSVYTSILLPAPKSLIPVASPSAFYRAENPIIIPMTSGSLAPSKGLEDPLVEIYSGGG